MRTGVAIFFGIWLSAISLPDILKEFPQAEKCKRCHESHYTEWKKSRHARSLTSPTFQQYYKIYLNSPTGKANADVKDADDCLFCHAPLLFAYPEFLPDLRKAVLEGNPPLEGVTCAVCHKISGVKHTKAIRQRITLTKGQSFFGPLKDPVESDAHESRFQDLRTSSDLCGACHGKFENPLACANNYDTYTQGWAPDEGVQCQNCHMGKKEGIAATDGPRREIHNHWFPGAYYTDHLTQAFHLGGKWKEDGTLYVTIENRRERLKPLGRIPSGHNTPAGCAPGTGMVLKIRFISGEEEVGTAERFLGIQRKGDFWEGSEVTDTTLKPGQFREYFLSPPSVNITEAVISLYYIYFHDPDGRIKEEPLPALIQEIRLLRG